MPKPLAKPPDPQAKQSILLFDAEYVPGLQSEQVEAVFKAYFPAVQLMQYNEPLTLANVPT